MAGKLVIVNSDFSDGTATYLQVTGIDSDNDYWLTWVGLSTGNTNEGIKLRVTKGGIEDSTGNYDQAHRYLSNTSNTIGYATNATAWQLHDNCNSSNGGGSGIAYLSNFNSSSKISILTHRSTSTVSNQTQGQYGGMAHTVASASDGVKIYGNSNGTFKVGAKLTLYKVL